MFSWKITPNHTIELFSRSEKSDARTIFNKFPDIYEIASKLDFKFNGHVFRNDLGYGRSFNIDLAIDMTLEDFENLLKSLLKEEYTSLKRQFDECINSCDDNHRYVEHLAKSIAEIKEILSKNGYHLA